MSTELTFVHQYSGEAPKRRRLAKACESCRSRKKRCVHFAGAEETSTGNARVSILSANGDDCDGDSSTSPPLSGRVSTVNETLNGTGNGVSQEQPLALSTSSRARFVSDLNPESTLLNRPPPATDERQKQPNDDIGVWVDRRVWDALVKQRNDVASTASQPILLNHGLRHNQRPHSAELGPLIDIYFKKIHPFLPLLDEEEFRANHAGGIVPEPLVHAMCLLAAKDTDAEPHLKLSESPATIPVRQFCTILHSSVTGALSVPVRFEKVTLIRILALMSLHSEGPEGAEESSMWLCQSIHYAQTQGIHLGQQASAPTGNNLVMKRLFWCLWVLDRTSAATNGRPIAINDADVAIESFSPCESGFPAFEALLKISQILNKIIAFYRPNNAMTETGWEDEYPGLEEIIDEIDGWQLPSPTLGTIHLVYLSVAILSHRSRGVKEIPRAMVSHVRQRLCAIEVVRLMNSSRSSTLHPLPIMPYAVGLALSVSYQHLRQSQMEHQQADALNDFRTCCRILQTLRRTWCSADVIATLAKKVLDELDRAPDLASFRIPRTKHSHGAETDPANGLIPPPTACRHDVGDIGASVPPADSDGAVRHGDEGTLNGAGSLTVAGHPPINDGLNLFDNMDDVFGTFMDPNYPLNLEDMALMDDISPFDWQNGLLSDG